jgi:hypothetical protein
MSADTNTALVVLRALQDEFELIAPHFRQLAVDLAKALATERSKAKALYCNVDWWGGSGSVADLIPEDVNARRRIMRLLVDLVRAFDELGIPCPRASQWTSIFVYWLQRGMI